MKKFMILVVLVLVGVGSFYWLSNGRNDSDITPINNITPEKAELRAYGFMQDFIVVASSESDQVAVLRIMDVLSKNASTQISRETISADLARFIGVQDVPDQGVSVEDLQVISPTESYLVVGLNYSGGRVLRNVHLIVEENEWKVDRVSISQPQAERFDREGNLVRNSPGMKSNVWYLVYESQGQPALRAELEFTQSSICAEGAENNTCDLSVLSQGVRVRILGEETNQGIIRVVRLEVK